MCVYIGTQLIVGAVIGIFLGIGVALLEWPESVFDDYTLLINIVAIAAAFLASWLLLKFLDRPVKGAGEGIVDSAGASPTNSSGQPE